MNWVIHWLGSKYFDNSRHKILTTYHQLENQTLKPPIFVPGLHNFAKIKTSILKSESSPSKLSIWSSQLCQQPRHFQPLRRYHNSFPSSFLYDIFLQLSFRNMYLSGYCLLQKIDLLGRDGSETCTPVVWMICQQEAKICAQDNGLFFMECLLQQQSMWRMHFMRLVGV